MEDKEILAHLQSLIGTPYVENGATPDTGFDCFGFFRYTFALKGIQIDEDFLLAMKDFAPVSGPARFLDGSYYRFDSIKRHVTVMLDNRRMIQCSRATKGVAICRLDFFPGYKGTWRHNRLAG